MKEDQSTNGRIAYPTPNNGKPIVALDIDGTLGDYHGHFLRFAEGWVGRRMPDPRDINPGLPLHKFMGVSKGTYRSCKLAYRQGGLKRSMPVYEGASALSRAIRRNGAEVWICTTRPYLRLDNIDPDTRHWLRRNSIQFDAVLWGEHKYRTLAKQVGASRIVGVLEDLPELAAQAQVCGLEVWLRAQPYNELESWSDSQRAKFPRISSLTRVDSLADAQTRILQAIRTWKVENT